jgi:hypothetical protein
MCVTKMLVRGSHRTLQFISRRGLPVSELHGLERAQSELSLGEEREVKQ